MPIDPVRSINPVDADPQTANSVADRLEIVWDRRLVGCRVVSVRAGDDSEHRGGICDGSRHRTDMVESLCERKNAVAAYPAPRRLDARKTAGGRRKPDRPSGIAAEAPVAKPQRC